MSFRSRKGTFYWGRERLGERGCFIRFVKVGSHLMFNTELICKKIFNKFR